MKIGIVGLPNVGKSTLFKALTKQQVDISNYPFCTIDPNVGVVAVPDERLEKIKELVNPEKAVPAVVEFVDVAGLVKGAHEGEGLGNQFLSHIREVAAIAEVVRVFENSGIVHVHGKLDAATDIEVINLELIYKDLGTVEKRLEDVKSEAKSGKKSKILELEILEKLKADLSQEKPARVLLDEKLEKNEIARNLLHELSLLSAKPIIYVFNISEKQMNAGYNPAKEILAAIGNSPYVSIASKLEAELADLSESDANEYMKSLGIKESGINRLIKAAYKLLELITFYTIVGGKETRAWPLKNGSDIIEAAGQVHTDFAEKFIRAQVIHYDKLMEAGSWQKAREKGLIRTEGKNYTVSDGDVIEFKI